jgi:hypothetical protein
MEKQCYFVKSRDGDLILCDFLDEYIYEGLCNQRECEYYTEEENDQTEEICLEAVKQNSQL